MGKKQKTRRSKAKPLKAGNALKKSVRTPVFKMRVVTDKTKYNRKAKQNKVNPKEYISKHAA